MNFIKLLLSCALAVLSLYMLYSGFVVFVYTSGTVRGSEFGVLLTLANQLALVSAWLSLFALRNLAEKLEQSSAQEASSAGISEPVV